MVIFKMWECDSLSYGCILFKKAKYYFTWIAKQVGIQKPTVYNYNQLTAVCICWQVSRGRWNSLDGVKILGWSGSALLGGVLLDKYGFASTFCVTAILQGIATCFLLPLLLLVPRQENAHHAVSTAAIGAVVANTSLAATDTDYLAEDQVARLYTPDGNASSAADELHELEQPLLLSREHNEQQA